MTEFEGLKNEVLAILKKQAKSERNLLKKAFELVEAVHKGGYPVGTIREWKGKKYMKVAPEKWVRKYDSHSKGASIAIGKLIKQVEACNNINELMNIVMQNKQRFTDANGNHLPIVDKLREAADKRNNELSANNTSAKKIKTTEKTKDVKTKTLTDIRNSYQAAKSVTSDDTDVLNIGSKEVEGVYKIVEAETPTASHDERTFRKTEGFPTNADGSTVNDRDYEHDTDAQESVRRIASDYDGRALQDVVIVTDDGIVVSGNNRTMSSKLAAKNGTDAKYIDTLMKRCKRYGFTKEDVAKFKHPRVVFEIKHEGEYTTKEFAQYNQNEKKAMSPTEKAVKISKTVSIDDIGDIASKIADVETLGDLYADNEKCSELVDSLVKTGIIQAVDKAEYVSNDGKLTASGQDFVETVLVGSVLNETNIRQLNTNGGKRIRQKLVRGILPLIENKGIGNEYGFNSELNKAVSSAVEFMKSDEYGTLDDYFSQGDMFSEKIDKITESLARLLVTSTQKEFASKMNDLGAGLRDGASGQFDIFLGGCESRDDVMKRVLGIKDIVKKALINYFFKRA